VSAGKRHASVVAKCILFDLDGTLYTSAGYSDRLESEILDYVSEKLRIPENACKEILNERRKRLGTLTRTLASLGIEREEFFHEMAGRLEPGDFLRKDPKILLMLKRLRKRGFKLALVSNSGRPLVLKILEAIGLDVELFGAIVTSSEAEPKPSHASFKVAMKSLGCTARCSVYVGDRIEAELRPAHDLGMQTILVGRKESRSSPYVNIVLENVSDLPAVIRPSPLR